MKTIYVDSDFKCHLTDDGTMAAVETDFFDGKCDTYIEGYRFVSSGSTWRRWDGTVFSGKMISPWKPWHELDAAQRAYEQELLAALREENASMLDDMAQLVEDVYESDRVILE